MEHNLLDTLMYQISGLFLTPVLLLIFILFIYSLYAIGKFLVQQQQRMRGKARYQAAINALHHCQPATEIKGFPLLNAAVSQPDLNFEQLELRAITELEGPRVVTRIAPMLGLIATMIPMGPALKSLADGNIQGISESLSIAFAAVIIGLIVSSVTYWIAAVSKRWYAEELIDLNKIIAASKEA
ncbi:MotA/TolQ/ExbB proton channel family protein [Shewanella youngdeokensis]|uniref:MotA/TolQ/ExbB proton channel family protein n=1 Tax=Shewanella youngdeokensis TaxID=2999068 RepID=A0ABZ0JX72_9GAMM|nr:MotA/TolQ/ExbB proton channel family protein [Shewanella sp. DAU334]